MGPGADLEGAFFAALAAFVFFWEPFLTPARRFKICCTPLKVRVRLCLVLPVFNPEEVEMNEDDQLEATRAPASTIAATLLLVSLTKKASN